MINKEYPRVTTSNTDNDTLVNWNEKYLTGIGLIDDQHKELVKLINQLFKACLGGNESLDTVFKETMSRMVEYVRFHCTLEIEMLARIKYPEYADHKKQHDSLVQMILDAAQEYNGGKNFVPHQFVRSLRDWLCGHIAISDKKYVAYIAKQKANGCLTDQMIFG